MVQLQPTIATVQTWTVQDQATIAVAAGAGDLQGDVVFELHVGNTTCSGSAALTTGPIAVNGASPQVVNSGTYTVAAPGGPTTYSWKVTYTSTNQGHKNVSSACHTENGTLTYTNGS